ncbi:MAG: hypothetical protein ACJ8FT_08905 [Sphingomonas sp.]
MTAPEDLERAILGAVPELTGEEVAATAGLTVDQAQRLWRALGFPGADDLGNMFQYKRDFPREFQSPRSVESTRALNPQLQSFSTWATRNASRVPING